MSDKKGIKITVNIHYPLVKELMSTAKIDSEEELAKYICTLFSLQVAGVCQYNEVKSAQEIAVEVVDDSTLEFDDELLDD